MYKDYFISLFYVYLKLKDKYFFNYISDKDVAQWFNEFDEYFEKVYKEERLKEENAGRSNIEVAMSVSYSWYISKQPILSGEMLYKLIFTVLIKLDEKLITFVPIGGTPCLQHYRITNEELNTYISGEIQGSYVKIEEDDTLLFTVGNKRWKESKVTFESCPFQAIRGMILSKEEFTKFEQICNKFPNTTIHEDVIKIVTSHGSTNSGYICSPTKEHNFKNYGLGVFSKDMPLVQNGIVNRKKTLQQDIIDKSIEVAKRENASILVFPELALEVDPTTGGGMYEYLKQQLEVVDHPLKLVVASCYYQTASEGSYKSISNILYRDINEKWKVLDTYYKMIPCTIPYTKQFFQEEINEKDCQLMLEDLEIKRNVVLINYNNLMIGITICRDAMDLLSSHNPIHRYCDYVDLLIVISDNDGDSNMFVGTAECLARWHNCATVYANAVCATQKGADSLNADNYLELSFGIYPYKGGRNSTNVSGEITYYNYPFASKKYNYNQQVQSENTNVGILYSRGIVYNGLTEEEKRQYCKVYELK